jgi:hypothetical protein
MYFIGIISILLPVPKDNCNEGSSAGRTVGKYTPMKV